MTLFRQPQSVALSGNIRPGDVHPVILHEKEFALWRGNDGVAHLWRDRCPHRGMRLSFGFIRENHLKCLYHGWEFRSDGSCQKIPAHPDLEPPTTLCVDTLPVIEKFGLIFAVSDTQKSSPSTHQWQPVRSLFFDFPQEDIVSKLNQLTAISFEESGDIYLSDDQMFACGLQTRSGRQCALHMSTRHRSRRIRLDTARRMVRWRHVITEMVK